MIPTLIQPGESRPCARCQAPFAPALYRGAGEPLNVPPGQPAMERQGKLFHIGCAIKMEAGQ